MGIDTVAIIAALIMLILLLSGVPIAYSMGFTAVVFGVIFSCLLLGERVIARLNCVAAGDVPRPGFIEGLYRIMHNWR